MVVYPTEISQSHLPIPYPAVKRQDSSNYGYLNLKRHPEMIDRVDELVGWPELKELVRAVNAPRSFFLSLGCERAFARLRQQPPSFEVKLTSYVDVAFDILELNFDLGNFHRLVDGFRKFSAHITPDRHTLVCFELRKTTYYELRYAGWSLEFWSSGFGETEDAARDTWRLGIRTFREFLTEESVKNVDLLGKAVKTVSQMG